MNILVLDNIIKNPDQYVADILKKDFIDFQDTPNVVFKGIQPRFEDELQVFVENYFPEYQVALNFVRQSPHKQPEPNFIHSDEMMGDKTILLYLNKNYPTEAGTSIYNNDGTKSCSVFMKYNRLFAFDSYYKHARNLIDNFGEGGDSRLVQVIFLKLK